MGYSYDAATGRLCCDCCPAFTGVRKRKCPFGFCPALAACKTCWETKHRTGWKKAHREAGCEKRAAEYAEREAKKSLLLASGKFLRIAARSTNDDRVHVLFRGALGEERGYYMTKDTYDAYPLLELVTPEDFEKYGCITPAPTVF